MNPADAQLQTHLAQLKLAYVQEHYQSLADQAAQQNWTPVDYLSRVSTFLSGLINAAEQLTSAERWHRILSKIFEKQLGGRPLKAPSLVLASG